MDAGLRSGTILLGKYRIESVLGRDGMCIVLGVTHLQYGGELAFKMLQPEAVTSLSVQARFLQEAQLAGRLRGEHVARVVDVGIMPDGAPFMVTEAVRGIDLASELARRGQLPPGEAIDILLQACEALAEAHAQGIVHRYICPGNVLLTVRPDGTPLVKVLDFGVSKTPASGMAPPTRADAMTGAPGYRAPEQRRVSAELDARTDIWSLGIVLYECLAGCHPFPTETPAAAGRAAMTETPRPMDARIPRELQAIVLRCLESEREGRFPSIAALAMALAPFARDHQAAAMLVDRVNLLSQGVNGVIDLAPTQIQAPIVMLPSASSGVSRSMLRQRYAIIGSVALAVTLLGVVVVALARRDHTRTPIDTLIAVRPHDTAASQAVAPPATRPAPPVAATDPHPPTPTPTVSAPLPPAPPATPPAPKLDAGKPEPAAPVAPPRARLGADRPEPARAAARSEVQNDRLTEKVRQALRDGDLKAAQAALRQLSPGAAYYAWLRDEVARAEREHDHVATRPAAPEPAPPAASAAPRSASCDSVDINDVMTRAAIQYDAGSATSALSLTRVALGCKQTDRMYWLAVMYACAAHDLTAARRYFPKVPPNLQPGIESKCQKQNLDVRSR